MRKIGRMPIFRKKEIERTRREKIIRDCVFFVLLLFICWFCIKTFNTMEDILEATNQLSNTNYLMPWVKEIAEENIRQANLENITIEEGINTINNM